MSSKRYLLNLAYMGAPFRGSQRQVKGGIPRLDDPTTVQGVLEMGLKYLDPKQDTVVCMAGRTDAGVNALNTTCHFDFFRKGSIILESSTIAYGLNTFLIKRDLPVKILNSRIVPDDFHCRHNAKSRTYLYRLIIGLSQEQRQSPLGHFIPIEEFNRAYFHCTNTFCLDTMKQAAKLFEGFHDFRSFMGATKDFDRITRRVINKIEIVSRRKEEVGVSPLFSWPDVAINNGDNSHLIVDVYINGKGFLYKQVRRTVATLLAAATNKISLQDVRFMLEVPSKHSWNPRVKSLPGYALYLCNVDY